MKYEFKNQTNLWDLTAPNYVAPFLSERLCMPDADVDFYPHFFDEQESDDLFQQLSHEIKWQQDRIIHYGKEIKLPRLTAWYGDIGKSYTYSHIAMKTVPWTPLLLHIKNRTEEVTDVRFNSVLLNLY
ncbi:MAG: alpha-ketoglutarate-dependent dioxygenase AlkB, partial [Pyrinomonadaceae bacterium]